MFRHGITFTPVSRIVVIIFIVIIITFREDIGKGISDFGADWFFVRKPWIFFFFTVR